MTTATEGYGGLEPLSPHARARMDGNRSTLRNPPDARRGVPSSIHPCIQSQSPWVGEGEPICPVCGWPLDARALAARLRQYEVKSTTIRIGEWHGKGYKAEDLWDAWSRYLPTPPQESVTSVTSVTTATPAPTLVDIITDPNRRACELCFVPFVPDPPSRAVCDQCVSQLARSM